MKAVIINGGPRKSGSTMQMLNRAMEGAKDAGADVEMIHLYDDEFTGCRSCFVCKLKNSKTNGVCAIRDSLRPILKKAYDADVIIIGSPVYLSNPTGPAKSFMERLIYPLLSYNPKQGESGEIETGIRRKIVPNGIIYAMGDTKEHTDSINYPIILGEYSRFMKMVFGHGEFLCSYFAYQFNDYSKYDVMDGLEPLRAKQRDEEFPKDLQSAYDLGKRLVEMAKSLVTE